MEEELMSFIRKMFQPKKMSCALVLFACALSLGVMSSCGTTNEKKIGIAWRSDLDSEFYTNIVTAIKEAGGTPYLLSQGISTDLKYTADQKVADSCVDENGILQVNYAQAIRAFGSSHSNAKDLIGSFKAVVFTGGEDISPSLLATPVAWHGIEKEKDYNATRDVSDYVTMSYCVENHLKVMGFCRGMQMSGVFSGATVIQDIPTYFTSLGLTYNYEHRNEKVGDNYRDYAPHDVSVKEDSRLYKIAGTKNLEKVPSWHHQALQSVANTQLKVTGTTLTDGVEMIESIERLDKTYKIGLQFHPEAALVKNLNNVANKGNYMSSDMALKFFKSLVND
jgi:putative glutamine amidotransferase